MTFSRVADGYDPREVDQYVDLLSTRYEQLLEKHLNLAVPLDVPPPPPTISSHTVSPHTVPADTTPPLPSRLYMHRSFHHETFASDDLALQPEFASPDHSTLSMVGNFIFYLILAFLVLGALSFTFSENPNKSFFGYRWYWIQTGSMEPALPVGALALVRIVEPEEIRVGDDATFYERRNNQIKDVTHRVVEVLDPVDEHDEILFVTKGVANEDIDSEPRAASQLIGKVIGHLPYVGIVLAIMRRNALLLGAMLLCLMLIYLLIRRQTRRNVTIQ